MMLEPAKSAGSGAAGSVAGRRAVPDPRRRPDRACRRRITTAQAASCSSAKRRSADGAARSRTPASRSITPGTSCSPTIPYVQDLYRLLLGDNVHWQEREAWICSKGVYTRYPFQGALHGLPPAVLRECLVGAIEARFGALSRNATDKDANGAASGERCRRRHQGLLRGRDRRARTRGGRGRGRRAAQLRGIHLPHWGAGVAKHFAIPYNRKLWTVPLDRDGNVVARWTRAVAGSRGDDRGRVAAGAEADGSECALRLSAAGRIPGADERLPAVAAQRVVLQARCRAGIAAAARRHVEGRPALPLRHADQHAAAAGADRSRWATKRRANSAARRASLRHVSVRCVNLGVARPHLSDKHWIYFPGGHDLPSHLPAGQCEPALQSARRLRPDLRDQLLADASRCR